MNKFRQLSLTSQTSILLLLLVMVVFSSFTLLATQRASKAIQDTVVEQLQIEVKLIGSNFEFFYNDLINTTDQLGDIFFNMFHDSIKLDNNTMVQIGNENLPVLTHGEEVLNNDFTFPDQFTRMTGGTATIFMRNKDDFLRVSTSLRKENGDRAFGTYLGKNHPGYSILMNGETYFGPAFLFGKNYMAKYTPIKSGSGEVIGILYVGFDYTKQFTLLKKEVSSIQFGKTGYAYAISTKPGKEGILVMHPSLEGKNLIEMEDAIGGKPFAQLLEGENGAFHYMWKGANDPAPQDKMIAYQKIRGLDWVIAAGSYTNEFIGASFALRNTLILLSLVSLVIIVVLIVVILRSRLKPLANIAHVIEQLGNGDLDVKLQTVDHNIKNSSNEIDIITFQSLKMVDHFKSVIMDMRESVTTLDNAMAKLSSVMNQTKQGINQQQSETEQVATAINEMAATAHNVAENSSNAAEQTKQADTQALEGKKAVSNVISSISELANEVEKAADVITKVEQESGNIDSVLTVIQGIAEQTNLLALNAAIEAARAGEQGRGFAVVADEVRSLAKRTQESTTEIQALIERLQASTQAAVSAMSAGQTKASESVERSKEAGNTLDEITSSVSHIAEMNIQIASAAEQQTSVTEEINQRVESIRAISNESMQGTQDMESASKELEAVSKKLQQNVARFKLSL